MPVGPGTRLGAYEIRSRIGAGGMGEVYRARHVRLERDVAIKVLPENRAGDADALARFEREARAVAALSHPNILAIHDFGTENGLSFAVMELLEGETLRQRLSRAPLPWRKAVELAVAIAEGLAAAHARGIVHRDLKPENLFVTTDGQLKILDFGLARLEQGPDFSEVGVAPTQEQTAPGTVLGTVAYMSPEQTRGETAGAPSDIFALGCVLHEMLTGERPFARASVAESMAAILKEDPAPPSSADPSIPPPLDALVSHCLEKAVGERFQSARDLALALRAVSTTSGSSASSTAVVGASPAGRPRRRLAAVGVAASVLVMAAAGLWLTRAKEQTPPSGSGDGGSIAVLPFEDRRPAEGDPYFVDSLSEAVITDLARFPGLTVINRDSAFTFRGRGGDARALGAALEVRYLLDGSVSRSGDRLQVQARLVDVATGDHRWTESYDRPRTEVFAIQEDIARSVAGVVRSATTPTPPPGVRRPPPDFEAYDLYLRGRAAWSRRRPDELRRAVELYQEAIRRDPGLAEAYAGLADAWIIQAFTHRTLPAWEAIPRAKAAAERALSLDPTLAEAHASLGNLLTREHEWDEAERQLRRAIELKPGYATAHHWYALLVLAQRGDLEKAEQVMSRAAALDPLAPALNGAFASILWLRGNYPEARRRAERARAVAPNLHGPVSILSRIAGAEGRHDEAVALARRAFALAAGSPSSHAHLARALAQRGDIPQARTILAKLEAREEPCVECIVDVQLAIGDLDAAVARVERGGLTPSAFFFPKADPAYDAYRADPRFRRILQAVRLD